MSGPSEFGRRDPADVDRVFAEMTAGWVPEERATPDRPTPDRPAPEAPSDVWAADHPLFRQQDDEPTVEIDDEPDEPYRPPAPSPIPWHTLSAPAVAGAVMMAFTVVVLLLVLVGFRFAPVIGYAAVASFVCGFALLMTRLRRGFDDDPAGGARL